MTAATGGNGFGSLFEADGSLDRHHGLTGLYERGEAQEQGCIRLEGEIAAVDFPSFEKLRIGGVDGRRMEKLPENPNPNPKTGDRPLVSAKPVG